MSMEKLYEKGQLYFAKMSHEIRTPLNAMLGMSEMILRECKDPQIRSYANNIQSSGQILLHVVDDILDLSYLESKRELRIRQEPYASGQLIAELWETIYPQAQEKGLDITFSTEGEIPGELAGDAERMKQIALNLLMNAALNTPRGGIQMKISFADGQLVFAVADTGLGIDEEKLAWLLALFAPARTETVDTDYMGFGMQVTAGLLRLMGGSAEIESAPGKGTLFTVRIPQKIVDGAPLGDIAPLLKRETPAPEESGFEAPEGRLLVVDDNAMNLTVFKALLKHTGLQITTANSGGQCMEIIEETARTGGAPFHMVFMDHMMPDPDGLKTFHQLEEAEGFPEGTPVIALTANAAPGAREFYLSEGFTDFLAKPVESALLEQMIRTYLPKELIREKSGGQADGTADSGEQGVYAPYLEYGISVEKGMAYAMDDMDVYLELVEMFLKDKEKRELMLQYIAEQNAKEYAVLVHGLKGNARTLGAEKLADMAYEHEKESKAGNLAYVKENWEALVRLWDFTLDGFGEFYGQYGEGAADDYAEPEGDIAVLSPQELEEAALLIEKFQTDEALARMNEWLDMPLGSAQHKLVKDAVGAIEDEFDEDKAMELLRAGKE